jgi:hypothetical protein
MNDIQLSKIEKFINNEDELNEIKRWLNNFQEEFNNKFENNNFDDIELIKQNIIDKYLFCESIKKTSIDNNIGILINNILSHFHKKIRTEVIENNIEKEISEIIIDKNIFLICSILKKNNMSYYDYIDKTEVLNKLHKDLCDYLINFGVGEFCDMIYWKIILQENNFTDIKNLFNLFISNYLKNKKSFKNKKIISAINLYLDTFNFFFNETFINDYSDLITNRRNDNK